MYALALLLPVAAVAHDVLEPFVGVDIVATDDVRGVGDDVLWDAYLARYLHGERRAGLAYLQLEEGLHEVAVVEHGAVDYSVGLFGEVLEVLVVSGDDAEGSAFHEALHHGLGHGASDLGLGAAAELIYEQQCGGVGGAHHLFHVEQVRAVGRELVLDALLVADVDHYGFEHAQARALAHGDGQAALEHVLQQPYGL